MLMSRRQFISAGSALCCAALSAPVAFAACSGPTDSGARQVPVQSEEEPAERRSTFFAFDTACAIGGVMRQDVIDAAVSECIRYEGLFSRTVGTSDIARVNAAGARPVEVHEDTARLVGAALGYCEESGGLFDITIGAVSSLWDFKAGIVPDPVAIEEALAHVDYRLVRLEGSLLMLDDPFAKLDLGGIAKGFIADRVIECFEDAGVESAYVNLGGNVKVLGPKADGNAWRLGVRDPFSSSENDVVAVIESTAGSLVTSGLYERRFEKEEVSYWHILDPRTGYPVETDLISATIYSDNSIDGDGLTKPLFMLSLQDALQSLESRPGIQGLLITEDGSFHQTRNGSFERL